MSGYTRRAYRTRSPIKRWRIPKAAYTVRGKGDVPRPVLARAILARESRHVSSQRGRRDFGRCLSAVGGSQIALSGQGRDRSHRPSNFGSMAIIIEFITRVVNSLDGLLNRKDVAHVYRQSPGSDFPRHARR